MPLSKLIVQMYAVILEAGLWLVMFAALIGGWKAYGFLGAIITVLVTAVISAIFVGAFLVLNEIRDRVKAIEAKQSP